MTVIGNKFIDTFLTGGLGSHRVHHVLPYQKSGFSNIVSEPIIREVCDEFKIEWKPTKNFLFTRLPGLYSYYIMGAGRLPGAEIAGMAGVIKEAFSLESFKSVITFIVLGFTGIGSI